MNNLIFIQNANQVIQVVFFLYGIALVSYLIITCTHWSTFLPPLYPATALHKLMVHKPNRTRHLSIYTPTFITHYTHVTPLYTYRLHTHIALHIPHTQITHTLHTHHTAYKHPTHSHTSHTLHTHITHTHYTLYTHTTLHIHTHTHTQIVILSSYAKSAVVHL